MTVEHYIIKRIDMIQEELEEIKKLLSKDESENVSLRGLWEGANITDEEIEEAKRSLFKGIEIDDFN